MPKKTNSQILNLEGLLTLRAISEAKSALLGSLESPGDVTLSIPPDADVDIAGIQIILAARVSARQANRRLSLSAPIQGLVRDTMEKAGFLEGMSAEDRQFWLHEKVGQ